MRRGPSGTDIFEILVREHADMLTAYLRSLVDDTSSVDDLFQETMIVAWRRLDDYDRSRPFGPWLRGIARNLTFAYYRRVAASPVWCSDLVLKYGVGSAPCHDEERRTHTSPEFFSGLLESGCPGLWLCKGRAAH